MLMVRSSGDRQDAFLDMAFCTVQIYYMNRTNSQQRQIRMRAHKSEEKTLGWPDHVI